MQIEEGAWERRDLESRLFVDTRAGSPVFSRTVAAALWRVPERLAGISGEMLRYSGGQPVKRSHSGLRKPRISELQHTPNLTLLPTSYFSLPVPFLSVLSNKLFPLHKSSFRSYPSVSVPLGTGCFSWCTIWSILTYPRFLKGF